LAKFGIVHRLDDAHNPEWLARCSSRDGRRRKRIDAPEVLNEEITLRIPPTSFLSFSLRTVFMPWKVS
jgi:hypothetical protein